MEETEAIPFAGYMTLLLSKSLTKNIKLSSVKQLPSVSGQRTVVVKAAPVVAVVSVDGCDALVPTKYRVSNVIYFSYLLCDTHCLLKEQLLMMTSQW